MYCVGGPSISDMTSALKEVKEFPWEGRTCQEFSGDSGHLREATERERQWSGPVTEV